MVTKGKMKICVYDGDEKSKTFGTLLEVFADGDDLKILKSLVIFGMELKLLAQFLLKQFIF